jgi:single-stranded DNA-binding protein
VVGREKIGEQWADRTSWVNVLISGKRAVSLAPILKEGDRIVVHGEIRNGKNADYVAAREVLLAGGGKRKGAGENSSSGEEEIPF